MDLQLTEEQELLSQAIRSMLAREMDEVGLVAPARSSEVWARLVEFGALGIGAGEDELGAVELALIARELGEVLAGSRYVDTAAVRYALAGSPLLGSGDAVFAVGVNEPERRFAPLDPATTLRDGAVTGEKSAVLGARNADHILVTARGANGAAVAAIATSQDGVRIEDALTLDPSTNSARVILEGCAVPEGRVIAGPGTGALIERLCAVGAVLSAAESVGAAAAVLTRARDYAAERTQFGHTIGSFQALRHLMAGMYVQVESSWSSVLYAAASLDERADDSLLIASIAKAYSGRALVNVAQDALQVFGGIAFTYEHPAHRFLRRVIALADQFGGVRDHEIILGKVLAVR